MDGSIGGRDGRFFCHHPNYHSIISTIVACTSRASYGGLDSSSQLSCPLSRRGDDDNYDDDDDDSYDDDSYAAADDDDSYDDCNHSYMSTLNYHSSSSLSLAHENYSSS